MADERQINVRISATRDSATTYCITIEERATGMRQVIQGVVADSAENALQRVTAVLDRNVKAVLGPKASTSRGPIIESSKMREEGDHVK